MSRDALRITVETVCEHYPEKVKAFRQGDETPLVKEVVAVGGRQWRRGDIVDEITKHVGSPEDYDPEDDEGGVRKMAGLPVIKEDGSRLAFKNPKSGSDTIHVARIEVPPDQETFLTNLGSTYTWSACGGGAARGKHKDNAIYLEPAELTDEYIERDGVVIGKLCGNCRKVIDPERDPFESDSNP